MIEILRDARKSTGSTVAATYMLAEGYQPHRRLGAEAPVVDWPVSLVFELIDRAIQLLRHRQDVSRSIYDRQVVPLMTDFEAVHRNYLDSFSRYRVTLRLDPPIASDFLDIIAADSLYSEDLRSRMRAFVTTGADERLRPLLEAIKDYLSLASLSVEGSSGKRLPKRELPTPSGDGGARSVALEDFLDYIIDTHAIEPHGRTMPRVIHNIARKAVLVRVGSLENENAHLSNANARVAIHVIDTVVGALQYRYDVVCIRHRELAAVLLDPS